MCCLIGFFFFFFQAEDGIRDVAVTGVQTCALPIYDAQGSGANYARDSLKKLWKRDMARDDALRVALEALFDAADEDVGTGGADLVRGIFPSVKMITRSGFAEVPEDEVRRVCEAVLADRARNATGS